MATDPLMFVADLLNENFDTQKFYRRQARVPHIYLNRWIGTEETEFPSISIFSHQQVATSLGFEAKNYLNVRQVRVEMRTDDLEELHVIEEEIQRIIAENSTFPQTKNYNSPEIEFLRINSTVDVFESIVDLVVYRRSLLIDAFTQYSY